MAEHRQRLHSALVRMEVSLGLIDSGKAAVEASHEALGRSWDALARSDPAAARKHFGRRMDRSSRAAKPAGD